MIRRIKSSFSVGGAQNLFFIELYGVRISFQEVSACLRAQVAMLFLVVSPQATLSNGMFLELT